MIWYVTFKTALSRLDVIIAIRACLELDSQSAKSKHHLTKLSQSNGLPLSVRRHIIKVIWRSLEPVCKAAALPIHLPPSKARNTSSLVNICSWHIYSSVLCVAEGEKRVTVRKAHNYYMETLLRILCFKNSRSRDINSPQVPSLLNVFISSIIPLS